MDRRRRRQLVADCPPSRARSTPTRRWPRRSRPGRRRPIAAPAESRRCPTPPRRRVWRAIDDGPQAKPWRVLSIVLLVLGCVLAPIGVTAGWAKNLVTNQEAYLEAVSPLVTDPVIVERRRGQDGRRRSTTRSAICRSADKIGDELRVARAAAEAGVAWRRATWPPSAPTSPTPSPRWSTSCSRARSWRRSGTRRMPRRTPTSCRSCRARPGRLHTVNVDLSSAVTADQAETREFRGPVGVADPRHPGGVQHRRKRRRAADRRLLRPAGHPREPGCRSLRCAAAAALHRDRAEPAGWPVEGRRLARGLDGGAGRRVAGRPRQWLVSNAPSQPDVTEAFTSQLTVNLQGTIRFVLVAVGGDRRAGLDVRPIP